MLQDQHPNHDLRRRTQASATATLRPPFFKRLSDDLNHGIILEERIDLSQPVGPQLVPIRQQNFEETPFALSTLNHARSSEKDHARAV
jgi:hypothetical protein